MGVFRQVQDGTARYLRYHQIIQQDIGAGER